MYLNYTRPFLKFHLRALVGIGAFALTAPRVTLLAFVLADIKILTFFTLERFSLSSKPFEIFLTLGSQIPRPLKMKPSAQVVHFVDEIAQCVHGC